MWYCKYVITSIVQRYCQRVNSEQQSVLWNNNGTYQVGPWSQNAPDRLYQVSSVAERLNPGWNAGSQGMCSPASHSCKLSLCTAWNAVQHTFRIFVPSVGMSWLTFCSNNSYLKACENFQYWQPTINGSKLIRLNFNLKSLVSSRFNLHTSFYLKHFPGLVRPARPALCWALALDIALTSKDSTRIRGLYTYLRKKENF